ncbi:phage portal protein, partial [Mycobacterium avium]|uniref:phage portal protein n=1 Tax=Mycobacterium avium TaxID=1764 RepID=UPI000A91DCBB
GYNLVDTLANPLGVVPVVGLRNGDLILGRHGSSEIDDLKPLVDALNKLLIDMMTTSEYTGRPRRWATGIELTEEPVLDENGNVILDDEGQPVTTEV